MIWALRKALMIRIITLAQLWNSCGLLKREMASINLSFSLCVSFFFLSLFSCILQAGACRLASLWPGITLVEGDGQLETQLGCVSVWQQGTPLHLFICILSRCPQWTSSCHRVAVTQMRGVTDVLLFQLRGGMRWVGGGTLMREGEGIQGKYS